MKRKMSVVLSATLALNMVAFGASQISNVHAEEDTNQFEAVSNLDMDNAKRSETEDSILKPGTPNAPTLKIDDYASAMEDIKKDLNKDINLPLFVSSSQSAIKGKLMKGVGVALYKLSDQEVKNKEFTPIANGSNSDNLISDSKFNIQSESGDFLLPFKNENLKPGDHMGICVSYSVQGQNKTFIIDSIYLGINAPTVKLNEKVDINSLITGLPSDATIEVVKDVDTTTIGSHEAKINIKYQNTSTPLSLPVLVSSSGGSGQGEVVTSPYRIAGSNRFSTNIESIKRNFEKGKVDTAIVASGYNFADPLAAGPLAMKMNAPIVFSGDKGLNSEAIKAINDLGVKNVIVVGGNNTVPASVETQLSGLNVRRIAGVNRYETSKLIAKEYGPSRSVIFTDGRMFADALSATPLSKKIGAPIVLVRNEANIPSDVNKYKDAYIVGGKNSVSLGIENKLKNSINKDKVYRVFGANRSQTSTQVSKLVKFDKNIIANGNSFADALSAVNMLNTGGKNLVLVGDTRASSDVMEFVNGKTNYIIGGYSTVPKSILGF
ncbi:MAG: cell wall-binding repeat-containing protein [Peptostreptococcus sp.]|uniref:cell wall-binding repeat-containing protein n=1 Tax=Peptostreptococcus sp. TaxID=1262 RepID=UPI002FC5E3BB